MVLGRLAHLAFENGARMPSIADDVLTEMYRAFSRAFADWRYGFDCISVFMGGMIRPPAAA